MDEAISAIQKGQTERAIKFLEIITLKEPNNEEAWMQLSKLVKYPWQEAKCLNKVISINPDNLTARHRLEQVEIFLQDKEKNGSDLSYPVSAGPSHAIRPKLKIRDSDILPEHDWTEAILDLDFSDVGSFIGSIFISIIGSMIVYIIRMFIGMFFRFLEMFLNKQNLSDKKWVSN